MWLAVFGVARSQLTRCIDQEEVGRVFGGIALLAAVIPFGSNPLFRMIFEKTKDWHPPALQMVTAAVVQAVAGILNLAIYSQLTRNIRVEPDVDKDSSKQEENGNISNVEEATTEI